MMTKEEIKRVTVAPPRLSTRVSGIRTGWHETFEPSVAIVVEDGRRDVRHIPAGLCVSGSLTYGHDSDLGCPVVRFVDSGNRGIIWRAHTE